MSGGIDPGFLVGGTRRYCGFVPGGDHSAATQSRLCDQKNPLYVTRPNLACLLVASGDLGVLATGTDFFTTEVLTLRGPHCEWPQSVPLQPRRGPNRTRRITAETPARPMNSPQTSYCLDRRRCDGGAKDSGEQKVTLRQRKT